MNARIGIYIYLYYNAVGGRVCIILQGQEP